MKKLLALSGLGSSVALLASSINVPKVVAIILVIILDNIDANVLFGGTGGISFELGTSIARDLTTFATSFFPASGGITNLVIGL
jgi:hypothetical protein